MISSICAVPRKKMRSIKDGRARCSFCGKKVRIINGQCLERGCEKRRRKK